MAPQKPPERTQIMGWGESLIGFALWTAVGLTAVFVPMPFGPLFAVVIAAVAARKQRLWPEVLGVGIGLGLFALTAGVNNLGPPPACSELGAEVAACSGVPPVPFLVAGIVLVVASAGLYLVVRLRHE